MTKQPLKTTTLLITAGCFLSFFVFGFTDNLKGPTLPAMIDEMGISYGTGGNIFFGIYLGFLITTLVTGILADRFGLKLVLMLAGGLLILGVGGYSVSQTAFLLGASLFVVGLGLGAIELGANAAIVQAHPRNKGMYLNLMAVLHGLGAMLAPLFAGWLLNLNVSWRVIYRWDILLIVTFVLIFSFIRFPKVQEQNSLDFRQIPKLAFKGYLPWFYAALMFYVAAEVGIGSWLVTFLQDVRGENVTTSTGALSLFFGLLMLGRLIGSFFVQKLGYLRSIVTASIASLICIIIGTFTNLSIFLPITGFFFSIIFPTFTATVSEIQTENTNTVLGMLFTFAGMGGLLGPWVIAWASDLLGLQIGFAGGVIFTILLVISAFILMKGTNDGQPA
ncbi:MAG: MFS transporter [Anaerolineales bacterium]|nr:MAG: MFS transporter [Anaerolineales bacterium]